MSEKKIKNPIIPGFYPDPSICRAGDDFYLVCSSFELYPGVPLFHSKDLANWESIGYVMTKENGFHVKANTFTGGVMAPTIRYADGTFYVINANFSEKGNYIVTAKDPKGPWSEPHWLEDVPGIDASLFLDTDGKAYIIGTGNVVERADGSMERGIYLCEFDLEQMKTVGKPAAIWDSALRGASAPEAPHLYHIGEYYYLIIAEGGTEHFHSVTVARSKALWGWYEGNPANPVMTHRHMGYQCDISNVGHADLIETPDGNWYAVMLASRTIDGYYKNLGRETFICPVIWERDWPVFSPQTGRLELEYDADETLPWTTYKSYNEKDDFTEDSLGQEWCFWGTPYGDFAKMSESRLYLKCLPRKINEPLKCLLDESQNSRRDDCVSFVGRRQTDISFEASCKMEFLPIESETAGIVIMQASNHQYRLERGIYEGKEELRLILSQTEMDVPPHFPNFTSTTKETVLAKTSYMKESVILKLVVNGQKYDFYYGTDEDSLTLLYENADGKLINPEIVGCMTGTVLGMFASGNGKVSEHYAAFDWFSYTVGL